MLRGKCYIMSGFMSIIIVLSVIIMFGGSKKMCDEKQVPIRVASEGEKNNIVKQDIVNYLVVEMNERSDRAESYYNGLAVYADILKDFHTWVKTKRYPAETEGAVVVRDYTAGKLAEATRGIMKPLGVFNQLISIREKPESLEELRKYIDHNKKDSEFCKRYYEKLMKNKPDYKTMLISVNEKAKMKQCIINYLLVEMNESDTKAEYIFNDFAKHEDILKEFHTWVKTKHYLTEAEGALVIHGYTAKKIAALGQGIIVPLEVYQYLIKLREKPKETLEEIEDGIPQYIY